MENANTCFINPDAGPLTIIVTADNGAISNWNSGHARFTDGSWEAIEAFQLATKETGHATYNLQTSADILENTVLIWQVLACGTLTGVEKAKFWIRIMQNGIEVFSKSSNRKIQLCKLNKAIKFKNKVVFKNQLSDLENNSLWDILEE